MASHDPVNLEALSLLGVHLQYNIPAFRDLTMTQIATSKDSLEILNRTLHSSYPLIKTLYSKAFGQGTPTSDLPGLIATIDHSRHSATVLWCIVPPLLVVIVGLRFWSRLLIMGRILLADWIVLAAVVVTFAMDGIFIYSQIHDAGKHAWDVPLAHLELNYMMSRIGQLLYLPNMAFVKLSLLLFYRELSRERWYTICVYLLGAFILVVTVAGVVAGIVTCDPAVAWKHLVDPGYGACTKQMGLLRFGVAYSATSDAAILILPIIIVARLQMNFRQRVVVIALLVLGGFGIFCAIALQFSLLSYLNSNDRTWHVTLPAVWCMLEACIGIICGSLPAIRVLFMRYYRPRTSSIGVVSIGNEGSDASESSGKQLEWRTWLRSQSEGSTGLDTRSGEEEGEGSGSKSEQITMTRKETA